MNDTIETIEYRGFDINIKIDEDALDPTKEFDMEGTIISWSHYKNFSWGHKYFYNSAEALYELLMENNYLEQMEEDYNYNYTENHFVDEYCEQLKHRIIALDIVGFITTQGSHIYTREARFNFNDEHQIGLIYVPIGDWKTKNWNPKVEEKDRILRCMEADVKIYNAYLNGEVYGYQIEPKDNNRLGCDDSCWGFYGDYEESGLLEEAKSSIDFTIKEYREEAKERNLLNKFMNKYWAY